MPCDITRRDLLSGVLVSGAAALLGTPAYSLARLVGPGQRTLHRRHSVFTPEGKRMLELYAIAVGQMKGLPPTNPLNWTNQADIHTVQMEHSSWWFLPWHRAYLWYFEWIVREQVKGQLNPGEDFAMPYWPWDDPGSDPLTGASYRQLPPEFRDPASKLFVSERDPDMNLAHDPASDHDDAAALSIDREIDGLLDRCQFAGEGGFGGSLTYLWPGDEQIIVAGALEIVHNAVHDQVGGALTSSLMGNLAISPLDPIFWVHHCNVDRLWELWLARSGSRENPTDPSWLNSLHPAGTGWFIPADNPGVRDQVASADFISGAARFDCEYAPHAAAAPTNPDPCLQPVQPEFREEARGAADPVDVLFAEKKVVSLGGGACQRVHINAGPTTLEVAPDNAGRQLLQKLIQLARNRPSLPVRVEVVISGVHADEPPGCTFRVFVNNPRVTAETSNKAPNYVGTISVLHLVHKHKMAHGDHPMAVKPDDEEFRFDISPLVFAKPDEKQFDLDHAVVTIVPVGPGAKARSDTEVSIGGVELRMVRTRQPSKRPGAPAGPPPGH